MEVIPVQVRGFKRPLGEGGGGENGLTAYKIPENGMEFQ